MLSSQPQLEYTGSGARYDIPDRPYKCNQCEKNFKDLGGMMQHQVRKNTCPIKHNFDVQCSGVRPQNGQQKIGTLLEIQGLTQTDELCILLCALLNATSL